MVAADYRQLQPIAGGSEMLQWCCTMDQYFLKVVHRTDDPALLSFLQTIRKEQPSRKFLRDFIGPRQLHHDLRIAVDVGMQLQERRGHHFMWLCVTNKGANEINHMALTYLKISDEERKHGHKGDPNAGGGTMHIKPDIWIRLTRNLD